MDEREPQYYFNNSSSSSSSSSFLSKGSQVEVSSDEDGVNGGWFVATVIQPPPFILSGKKNNKLVIGNNNNLVYVEYHNLVSEDGCSRRLREYANVCYVRPSPPGPDAEAPPNFQLNDLVDAFYRDGWWTGVITAVVDSSNFLVTFQNPPDQIHFNSSDLRLHRRWDGARWVQPEIQRIAGLMFTVAKKVEVCFEGDNLHHVWFPATVLQNLGNNSFLVEYRQPGTTGGGDLHKVTVDYLHIRPSPPHLRDKNFVLLEKVDAYYDFGWWSGVITKQLADDRYNVFFKHTKNESEFDCSRVRPHMEWKGGKWFTTSQISKRGKNVELKTPSMISSRKNGRLESELSSLIALGEGAKDDPVKTRTQENVENVEKDVTKDLTLPVLLGFQCNGMTISEEKKLEQVSSESIPNVAQAETKQPCVALAPLAVVDKEGKEGEAETVAPTPKRKRGRPPKLQAISPETPPVAAVAVNHENEGVGLPAVSEMEGTQRSASSGTRPLKQLANTPQNPENTSSPLPLSNKKLTNENVQVQPQEGKKQRRSYMYSSSRFAPGKKYSSMKGRRGKRRTISINTESPTEDSREKTDKDDNSPTRNVEASVGKSQSDYQPLSSWSVQSPMTSSIHGTDLSEGPVEQPRERQLKIVTFPPPPSSFGDNMPFKISSPTLWKTIESMDAFRKIPQKPHFRALESMKQSGREGLAIGSMVTFSTVVDKTCALRFQDPRSAIEECLETLAELETHGFEVELIRDRLTRLLLIKDEQEELQQRSKGITHKVEEHKMEGDTVGAEIGEIDREIMELEVKRRQLLSNKEKHQSTMGVTRAAGEGIHQQLREVEVEFEGLAAAPFLISAPHLSSQ